MHVYLSYPFSHVVTISVSLETPWSVPDCKLGTTVNARRNKWTNTDTDNISVDWNTCKSRFIVNIFCQWISSFTLEEFFSIPLLSSCGAFLEQTDTEQCVFSRWWLQGAHNAWVHHIGCRHWFAAGFQHHRVSVCLQRTLGKMCPTLTLAEVMKQRVVHF